MITVKYFYITYINFKVAVLFLDNGMTFLVLVVISRRKGKMKAIDCIKLHSHCTSCWSSLTRSFGSSSLEWTAADHHSGDTFRSRHLLSISHFPQLASNTCQLSTTDSSFKLAHEIKLICQLRSNHVMALTSETYV